jgi:hypothetical protein
MATRLRLGLLQRELFGPNQFGENGPFLLEITQPRQLSWPAAPRIRTIQAGG